MYATRLCRAVRSFELTGYIPETSAHILHDALTPTQTLSQKTPHGAETFRMTREHLVDSMWPMENCRVAIKVFIKGAFDVTMGGLE